MYSEYKAKDNKGVRPPTILNDLILSDVYWLKDHQK